MEPLCLDAIRDLNECLSYIEVRSFNDTICARVIARNADVIDMVALAEVRERFDKGWAVIGDDFVKCSPSAYEVLKDPIAKSSRVFFASARNSGQVDSEQRPCTMYFFPAEAGRCIVSMNTLPNKGAGVATIGGMRTF